MARTVIDNPVIEEQKNDISNTIKNELRDQNLSLRKLADHIDGMSYPQICRVTSGKNYNILTLIRILDALGLEVEVKKKK